MRDLSVLITARNEEFLKRTVEDVLNKKRANTEIIVVMDGGWADPPLQDHPDVTIIYHKESVGQRAAVNEAARLSRAKFIMKLDAHCIMDEGFDVKLMERCEKDWIVIPAQYNLHVFNWKCEKCGNEWYQSPTPKKCQLPGEGKGDNPNCDGKKFRRVIVWKKRESRKTVGWRFDSDLHFQYWGDLKNRLKHQGDIMDTMSCLGACWFLHRERYWEIDGLDEEHGSWGQMGTELACKSWLSGGKMVTNKKTWFAHMFRTQGGDFGFPYEHKQGARKHAIKYSQDYWRNNRWSKAVHSLEWLIEKFSPVPGWEDKSKRGIIYYTDNQLKLKIARAVQSHIRRAALPIVSASLKPMDKMGKNIFVDRKRGYLTMFKQILAALEGLDSESVFFCEHDVLYHPNHFQFKPQKKDVWYYNVNVWKVDTETGKAIRTKDCKQVSGICVNRETAVTHYKKRIELVEEYIRKNGEKGLDKYIRKMGFEPGTHQREERVDNSKAEGWSSKYPNIDFRHDNNLTPTKWSPEDFVNKKYAEGWKESHIFKIPGWDRKSFDFLGL